MSFTMVFTRICIYICFVAVVNSASVEERIRTPGEKGEDVVKEVVKQVQSIFGDDKDFLAKVACAESNNGLHPNTYRNNYHGGIWQVDKIGFADTQNVASHPGLSAKYDRIQAATGIVWPEVQWEDLRMPLHSGLASRLYISNIPEPIPDGDGEQAEYWDIYYNTEAGAGNPDNFPTGKKRRQMNDDDEKDIDDFLNCPNCVCRKLLIWITIAIVQI